MFTFYDICLYGSRALVLGLIFEMTFKLRYPWAIPSLMVYFTTVSWYFVDPFQFPEIYAKIPSSLLTISYLQIACFLLTFRWLVPNMSNLLNAKVLGDELRAMSPTAALLFRWLGLIWVLLACLGVYRMNGNVLAALIPLDGRAGSMMWDRDALGGTTDALISVASYSYQLVCCLLGVTLILQKNSWLRLLNCILYFACLPFFLFSGTRNTFIGVIAPLFLTYMLVGRPRLWIRSIHLAISFAGIYLLLLTVIENRNHGFRWLFDETYMAEKQGRKSALKESGGSKQLGLNMIEELCFINEFIESGVVKVVMGERYLIELTNVIPRALWPQKPTIGVDYAIARGFSGGNSSIGVNATISTGMIGGGVMNFGQWVGPSVAALLFAVWVALLSRWWQQRESVLRFCLFIAGLGLTFNLGRDITLLVLWPVVFAYFMVRLFEFFGPYSAVVQLQSGPPNVMLSSRSYGGPVKKLHKAK